MEQTEIKEEIAMLEQQKIDLVAQANQGIAYINGQIEVLKRLLGQPGGSEGKPEGEGSE